MPRRNRMRKLIVVALALSVGLGLSTLAVDLTIGLGGFSVSMEHINGLIEGFEQDAELGLSPLRTGAGVEANAALLPIGGSGALGFGGRGLFVREASRGVSITASMFGLFAQGGVSLGRWLATADVGAYYGTYSFPASRVVDLGGWGIGLAGRLGYALPVSERLAIVLDLGLRWLPIQEMKDPSGQRFRGRGTPFMDFSGISASIGLAWGIPERSDE
jgi:hypothetical protein